MMDGPRQAPDPVTLENVLLEYDYNYTRQTEIFWSSATHQTLLASGKNIFPFTSTRTTLFVENGLYMYTTNGDVNSGYYSRESAPNEMRHYTINGGKDQRDEPSATLSSDDFSGGVSVNDYYVGMHVMRQTSNLASLVSIFGDPVIDGTTYTWSSEALASQALTLKNLSNQDTQMTLGQMFMYFTAPTFTNPILDEEDPVPFFTFSRAQIVYNSSGELLFELYTDEKAKLENPSGTGLFSSATISMNNNTTIGALTSYINDLES
jgi:hypothetical protein